MEVLHHIHEHGIKVIVNDLVCLRKEFKQYKFPKSKKVRIRKKWKKNFFRNYQIVEVDHFITVGNDTLIVSSRAYKLLQEQVPYGK